MNEEQRKFYERQINDYKKKYPLYEQYCTILKKILTQIVEEVSSEFIIQERVKSISSFADKITRLNESYTNQIENITDFCGIRIILPNFDELNAVNELIRKNFAIAIEDKERKLDKLENYDIKYISNYFIVQLLPKLNLYQKLNLEISDEIKSLKAEIQVRTYLQHAWAINYYDKFLKSEFKVPKPYFQELNQISTLLETADNSLNNLMKKMRDYESNYGAYMSKEKINKELERLEFVYATDRNNIEIAYKIAKLARDIEDWEKAKTTLESVLKTDMWKNYPDLKSVSIYRDLGIAICKMYDPSTKEFEEGQNYLMTALSINPNDSDAYAALGGTYKIQKKEIKAYECYKQALDINPGDPYPLGNYLIYEIRKNGNLDPIKNNREMIEKAIKKRLNQIEVKVDFPWPFFDLGTFYLFLGDKNKSLINYLMAIKFSSNIWMIKTTLDTLEMLKDVYDQLNNIKLIECLLMQGIAFLSKKNLEKNQEIYNEIINKLNIYMQPKERYFGDSIVIIAGGTDVIIERNIQLYRNKFIEAFRDFKGTIISGGTQSGICGIVGDIQEKYPKTIRTIGYIPKFIPSNVEIDRRYTEIHATDGNDFSILETFQYWYDILKTGVNPSNIKLIGINGGKISALEFRIAIVFGAQVGIIEHSGRAASELINDQWWIETSEKEHDKKPKRLFKVIKNTSEDIYNFLTKPFITDPDIENLQKIIIRHQYGIDRYVKNFNPNDYDDTRFAGLITALDNFGSEINVGEIISIKFKDAYLTGGFFTDMSFKVLFLLTDYPSESLEKKIAAFIIKVEKELGDHFNELHRNGKSYLHGKEMEKIFSDVFGPEILKLF